MTQSLRMLELNRLFVDARAGSLRAFDALIGKLWLRVHRKARRITDDWQIAVGPSSLTQEVFIGLAKLITKVRGTNNATLFALLDKLLRSKSVSAFRHAKAHKRDGGTQPSLDDVPSQLFDEQPNPHEQLENRRDAHRLLVAIAKLDDRHRIAMEGTLADEPPEAIGARLGIDGAAVSNLVCRVKAKLGKTVRDQRAPDALAGALLLYLEQRSTSGPVDPQQFAASHPQQKEDLLELLLWLEAARKLWNGTGPS